MRMVLIMCADRRHQHPVKTLKALKSDRNPVKEAAMAAINRKAGEYEPEVQEIERKKEEARGKAKEAGEYERKVQEIERWTENAENTVLGLENRLTEML